MGLFTGSHLQVITMRTVFSFSLARAEDAVLQDQNNSHSFTSRSLCILCARKYLGIPCCSEKGGGDEIHPGSILPSALCEEASQEVNPVEQYHRR